MLKVQVDSKNSQCFYIHIPYQDIESRNKIKKLGGLWDMQKKCWKFAFDLRIWQSLVDNFGEKLQVSVVFKFLLNQKKKKQEQFLSYKDIAQKDQPIEYQIQGLRLKGKNPLFNYQKHGIKCGLQVGDGFLLGDVPGLGKTIQGIGLALQRKNRGQIQSCLVICPASLKYNWLDEIHKFTKQNVLVVDGTKQQRKQKWLAKNYFFKIVGYQTVTYDLFFEQKKGKQKVDKRIDCYDFVLKSFDCLVVDEVHAIKHTDSLRSKALKKFQCKYRIGLTGTPIDGKLQQIQALFSFLKPGLFPSRSKFLQRYAHVDFFGRITGYKNIGQVKQKIKPYYLRRLKQVVLKDLPKLMYKDLYVQLQPREMKAYKNLIKKKSQITQQAQAIELLIRARQFCDFPQVIGMRNKSSKYEILDELLRQLIIENNQKVIIFTQYKTVLDLLYKNLKEDYNVLVIHGDVQAKQRVELCKKFNQDKSCQIILGTDAMSTGLNLQQADALIHYEDNFSPALMIQRNNRCNRATSKKSATVYRFITKDTIQQKVRQKIQQKTMINDSLLDQNTLQLRNTTISNMELLDCL